MSVVDATGLDSFRAYLTNILSIYENGPFPTTIPSYDGPSDPHTDNILRAVGSLARRMHKAEQTLAVAAAAKNDRPHASTSGGNVAERLSVDLEQDVQMSDGETALPAELESSILPTAAPSENGMSATEELGLLKAQISDVARVCNAVKRGDFSQKISVPVEDEAMVQLKDTVNSMVVHLQHVALGLTLAGTQACIDGKLGGQALVLDVDGAWRDLVGIVNNLLAHLTSLVRSVARVTKSVALGDMSKQIDGNGRGEFADLKTTVNGMVVRLRAVQGELSRVTSEVGSRGAFSDQAYVPEMEGVWLELVRNVNRMCVSLTNQVRSIASVTTAVAGGDLTRKVDIHLEGEMAALKTSINSLVDQLAIRIAAERLRDSPGMQEMTSETVLIAP
ncbi:hypothetical protein BV25DRAFT_1819727 [Artomyces pyxidatus]|uniref:Uncharacterized protein n=1 Tax=Artomyces pyxidatus TaxID=48021 RepID=A0ACB8TG22_9AGAM|nr:hypothetical protein BV25DRAFT_1819727 [Artomyces pyxidatus]